VTRHEIALNPLNSELNPICYLLALLGAHHFLHVSKIRVKSLTLRLLMSYIYGAPILDVLDHKQRPTTDNAISLNASNCNVPNVSFMQLSYGSLTL